MVVPKPPAPKPPAPKAPAMVVPKPPAMVAPKPWKKKPNSQQRPSIFMDDKRLKNQIKPVVIVTDVKQQVHKMIERPSMVTPKQSVPPAGDGFCVTADGFIKKMPMIKNISISNRSDCQGTFFLKSRYTGCLYKENELEKNVSLKQICVSDEFGHAAALFNGGQNAFCFAIRENKGDKTCSIDTKGSPVTTTNKSQDLPSELTAYLKLANK